MFWDIDQSGCEDGDQSQPPEVENKEYMKVYKHAVHVLTVDSASDINTGDEGTESRPGLLDGMLAADELEYTLGKLTQFDITGTSL